MKKAKKLGHPELFLVSWWGNVRPFWKRAGVPYSVQNGEGVKLCAR